MKNKLELGSGHRPTPGYMSNDVNNFEGIDIVGNPWEINLKDDSLEEVLALGLIEHLTFDQVNKTFLNVHRMLKPGGIFLFDVPDIIVWCKYAVDYFQGKKVPFDINHIFSTLYGWQRWPGDEHKSGWYMEKLCENLNLSGFKELTFGVNVFLSRDISRRRMTRPEDAHIYCEAKKLV